MNMELEQLNPPLNRQDLAKVKRRYHQEVTEAHLLAYIFNPRYQTAVLPENEYSKAMEFMENEYPELMPICINLRANSPPFHKSYLFDELSLIHISEPTRLL